MAEVILTTSLVGAKGSFAPGDTYVAASEKEAQRMIKAGLAKKPDEKKSSDKADTKDKNGAK